jgi:predicted AlkP superfamily pyrophosphatase or phosphodiesterase
MNRVAVINVVGLTAAMIDSNMPHLAAFAARHRLIQIQPTFPAVTCTAQATYLTGTTPAKHGIVGNGWFDRALAEIHFWKQSNRLVVGRKVWDEIRDCVRGFTVANIFWWFNMYSSVDYAITPRPIYRCNGKKVFDISSSPLSIRGEIKCELGAFPFHTFWGPMAGLASSRWIADAARWIESRYQPGLSLIYLPHLDYNLQRYGPSDPRLRKDRRAIDEIVGTLIADLEACGCRVLIVSEYGVTDVHRPMHLNRQFRLRGWLAIKDELGLDMLDAGASRAFAVADHQIAHVYVQDPGLVSSVRAELETTAGVAEVLDVLAQKKLEIWHTRSGDFLVVAEPDAWFTYYYWLDDARAPDFARCVDIHRKAGYDPVELFCDPRIRWPRLKVAQFLLRNALGFRAVLDLIPLDATLVRGSHGRMPISDDLLPVLLGDLPEISPSFQATDVYRVIRDAVLEKGN